MAISMQILTNNSAVKISDDRNLTMFNDIILKMQVIQLSICLCGSHFGCVEGNYCTVYLNIINYSIARSVCELHHAVFLLFSGY